MNKHALTLSLLAALSAASIVPKASAGPIEEQLVHDGMTQMSEGLYAKVITGKATTEEAYVATNREGEQALLAVLLQDRQRFHLDEGRDTGSSNAIDAMIEQINRHPPVIAATTQDYYGNCNGVNSADHTFHVNAAAGPAASHALAENNMPGPVLNTTNSAFASIWKPNGDLISSDSHTTFASTDASASVTAPVGHGCTAAAGASVSCPGGGGITAYASSVVTGCIQ